MRWILSICLPSIMYQFIHFWFHFQIKFILATIRNHTFVPLTGRAWVFSVYMSLGFSDEREHMCLLKYWSILPGGGTHSKSSPLALMSTGQHNQQQSRTSYSYCCNLDPPGILSPSLLHHLLLRSQAYGNHLPPIHNSETPFKNSAYVSLCLAYFTWHQDV